MIMGRIGTTNRIASGSDFVDEKFDGKFSHFCTSRPEKLSTASISPLNWSDLLCQIQIAFRRTPFGLQNICVEWYLSRMSTEVSPPANIKRRSKAFSPLTITAQTFNFHVEFNKNTKVLNSATFNAHRHTYLTNLEHHRRPHVNHTRKQCQFATL